MAFLNTQTCTSMMHLHLVQVSYLEFTPSNMITCLTVQNTVLLFHSVFPLFQTSLPEMTLLTVQPEIDVYNINLLVFTAG